MGLDADPRKAEHSALIVVPSLSAAVASVAPDSGAFRFHPHATQHFLHVRCEAAGVGESVDTDLPVQDGGGGAILHAELTVQTAARQPVRNDPVPGDGWSPARCRRWPRAFCSRRLQRRLDRVLHIYLGGEPLDVKARVEQPPRRAQPAGGRVPVEARHRTGRPRNPPGDSRAASLAV